MTGPADVPGLVIVEAGRQARAERALRLIRNALAITAAEGGPSERFEKGVARKGAEILRGK